MNSSSPKESEEFTEVVLGALLSNFKNYSWTFLVNLAIFFSLRNEYFLIIVT